MKNALNDSVNYVRPETRGELVRKLKQGIPCEVVSSNAEITSIMLRGWLDFYDFSVKPSVNPGWSIFEYKKKM